MNKKFTKLLAAFALLVFMTPSLVGWGQTRAEGDELAVCQGTGSGYGTRRTLTDSHNVGWVLASGQSGYLGANNATNHNNVKPTAADLPVVKAVKSDATTSTTGYYFYYTTTAVANVGSLEFSYTGNSGNANATAYVVVGDALSASGGDAYEIITLASNSSTAQGASLGSSGTFTYTFSETQISPRFYGFIIVTSSYKRLTAGTIKLKEGAIATVSYSVTLGDDNTTLTEANPGAGVTLPSRDDIGDYTFAGWNTTNITEETTTAPTIISAGLYHPTADITLYPVYSRSESGATTWTKVVSSSVAGHPSGITEGVYALLTGSDKAFNGSISSGHGQSTTEAFVFTDNVATNTPSGTCEITMVPVMSGETILGYKMYNASYGYLYASAASSGNLAWHDSESSYWSYSNYDWCYNANTAHLRVYNDTFRTYANSSQTQIKVARKGAVSTTYYISVVSVTFTVTYNANGGTGEDFVDDKGGEGYASGATVTVLANEGTNNPNFTKTGHSFYYWSDAEDGSGNLYDPDDDDANTFEITNNTTLYAQWGVNHYNVALASVDNVDLYAEYDTNEMLIEGENANIDYGTTLTLIVDNLASGSAFVWHVTDGDNNDVTEGVLDGNILTVPAYNITISGSIELNYTVIFDSNGVETIVSQPGNPVFSLTAPTNVPTGFTFVGWTMYETELDVDDLLEGTTVNLSDYNTDNASLYAVFSGEVGAFPAIPATPGSFVKVEEDLSDWSGTYLIVHEGNQTNPQPKAFDGSLSNLDVSLNTKDVTILDGTTITATDALVAAVFTIASDSDVDNYPYTIKSASGFYIGNTSSSNGFNNNTTTKYGNSIAYDSDDSKIVIKGSGDTRLQYYQNSDQSRFKYYKSDQKDIQLYKYVEGTPGAPAIAGTTQRFIRVFQNETAEDYVFILGPSIIPSGYYLDMGDYEILSEDADMFIIEDGGQLISDQEEVYATVLKNIRSRNNGGGWNFVASPIFFEADPTEVGMITTQSDYDLYRFNPNAEVAEDERTYEWENYKIHNTTEDEFVLFNGHACLYANTADVVLQFSGLVNSPDAVVSYDYNESSESELKDWHLVGNPYMYEAYPNMSYYVVSGSGIAEPEISGAVAPCEGIMIQGTDGLVNFTRTPENAAQPSDLQMTLAQQVINRGTVSSTKLDKAIISFNEGSQLGKFYFGESAANIYIPQGNEEFAIVSTEVQGEMPVNFRASENGTYSLSIDVENMDMNYLHLIDNMTGRDVDLLQTSSYTFEAKVNDYESRFRLVFAANNNNEDGPSTGSGTFAFYSNGNWIINNAGEATLQVIDLTGRILSSETVNGSVSKTINATPGVYMLRLINGENVNVQKIVVR